VSDEEPDAPPAPDASFAPERAVTSRRPLFEALAASALVTALVTAASRMPDRVVALAVGAVFLGATWLLVWRRDDALVERYGLSFAGLVLPGRIDPARVARALSGALGWALLVGLVTFPAFFFGWRAYWGPRFHFSLEIGPVEAMNTMLGQLAVIALPEEAFYRGYLQTRLGEFFTRKVRIFGAPVGLELIVASAIFALGHVATVRSPGRLAVFFPALVFGWLRARTKGIGAGVVYHALCYVLSEALGRGYGLY
jgi:membrane protease YdiL (CAAX protease family)